MFFSKKMGKMKTQKKIKPKTCVILNVAIALVRSCAMKNLLNQGTQTTIQQVTMNNAIRTPNQGVFSRSLDISPVRWVFDGKTYII